MGDSGSSGPETRVFPRPPIGPNGECPSMPTLSSPSLRGADAAHPSGSGASSSSGSPSPIVAPSPPYAQSSSSTPRQSTSSLRPSIASFKSHRSAKSPKSSKSKRGKKLRVIVPTISITPARDSHDEDEDVPLKVQRERMRKTHEDMSKAQSVLGENIARLEAGEAIEELGKTDDRYATARLNWRRGQRTKFVVIAIVGVLIAGAIAGLIVGITLAVQNKQKDKDQTG